MYFRRPDYSKSCLKMSYIRVIRAPKMISTSQDNITMQHYSEVPASLQREIIEMMGGTISGIHMKEYINDIEPICERSILKPHNCSTCNGYFSSNYIQKYDCSHCGRRDCHFHGGDGQHLCSTCNAEICLDCTCFKCFLN